MSALHVANPRFDEEAVEQEAEKRAAAGEEVAPIQDVLPEGNWWQRRTPEGKRLVLIGVALGVAVVTLLGVSIATGAEGKVGGTFAPTRSPLAEGQTHSPSASPTMYPTRSPLEEGQTFSPTPSPIPAVLDIVKKDAVNNQGEPSLEWKDDISGEPDCTLISDNDPNWTGDIGIHGCQPLNGFMKKMRVKNIASLKLGVELPAQKGAIAGSLVAGLDQAPDACPNYQFTWARDQAVVYSAMLDEYERIKDSDPQEASNLVNIVKTYGDHAHEWYLKNNGLGGTYMAFAKVTFQGDGITAWCNPQNDGPALRAIHLMRLYEILEQRGDNQGMSQLYSTDALSQGSRNPIKRDLDYLINFYDTPNCEPWEEINGRHFYDRVVAYTAMVRGEAFARKMGNTDFANALRDKIAEDKNLINSNHWKAGELTIQPEQDDRGDRKDDIQTVFAMAHAYLTEDDFFGPGDTRMMANALFTINSFNNYWPINEMGWKGQYDLGPAIGRYIHDSYGGGCPGVTTTVCPEGGGWNSNCRGNAWHLATAAMAEYFYRVALHYKEKGFIEVDRYSGPTYDFFGAGHIWEGEKPYETATIRFESNEWQYSRLLTVLVHAGDQFLRRNKFHTNDGMELWEQFNGFSGFQHSTKELTWSHAAVYTAIEMRTFLGADELLEHATSADHIDVEIVATAIDARGATPVLLVNPNEANPDCDSNAIKLYKRKTVFGKTEWSTFVSMEKNGVFNKLRLAIKENSGECRISAEPAPEIRTTQSNKVKPEYFVWKCPVATCGISGDVPLKFYVQADTTARNIALEDTLILAGGLYADNFVGDQDNNRIPVPNFPISWDPCSADNPVGVRSAGYDSDNNRYQNFVFDIELPAGDGTEYFIHKVVILKNGNCQDGQIWQLDPNSMINMGGVSDGQFVVYTPPF